MAKPAARIVFLQVVLAIGAAAILARSFMIQVVQYRHWAAKGAEHRGEDDVVRARRGRIFDNQGRQLATSQEQYRLSISLDQVTDTARLLAVVSRSLDLPRGRVEAAFRHPYAYFYGPFRAEQVQPLRTFAGVHPEVLYERVYPMESVAKRLLGRLDEAGNGGTEGIEKALDSLLQGHDGKAHYLKDNRGNRLLLPGPPLLLPEAGHDVYLTIDADLQGIAEEALRKAVDSTGARGGDVVVMNAHTGELLAVASLRTDSVTGTMAATTSALVEPNQPGSTAKIFTAAALLRNHTDTTPVNGEGGTWTMSTGRKSTRTIHDVHKLSGLITLGETIKYSSNIAISKFALRLQPAQQYETLRDFGFGTPSALGFPGEASGKLTRPALWANADLSRPSLGQGYEWEASAVQLAAGYAAIANHGVVVAPTLIKSVRDGHGAVVWQHHADTLRRAVSPAIDSQLLAYLALVTDSGGTGLKAQLDKYRVIGKSGTAQRGLGPGDGYRGSFAAIFPLDDPQTVVYVMIDRPTRVSIYGGEVAAPVVRTLLQQALSGSRTSLGIRLAAAEPPAARRASFPDEIERTDRVAFPITPARSESPQGEVPYVSGLGVREAIVVLERAGFQVSLQGRAKVRNTEPAAGDSLARGSVVTIHADSIP